MARLVAIVTMVLAMLLPALAQDDATPWRASITGQIEALRAQNGEQALSFAGAGFRTQFEKAPETFYAAIIASGYGPIASSRSHNFGEVREISETSVVQTVNFVGSDQSLYRAAYQMGNEDGEGWRVQAVILQKQAGIGV